MNKNLIAPLLLFLVSLSSCNKEEIKAPTEAEQQIKGRFDNSPFTWDYKSDPNSNKIFIGDINVNKNTNNISPADKVASSSIFIGSNSNIYPGGIYPQSRIDDFTFNNAYPYEKNLFDYYFGFTRKFIVEDVSHKYGRGLREYYKAEAAALQSQQFKSYIAATDSRNLNFSSVQALTYSDIEKSFSANTSFGKIFTSKMSQNKKSTSYKSIYFARLETSSFEVIFEPDYKNFFVENSINEDVKLAPKTRSRGSDINNKSVNFEEGAPFYVRNMSYGNYAYLAIESDYSFSEVKTAIEGTFNLWKIDAAAKYDKKTVDILSKSSVTILISGKAKGISNATETYWATSLNTLVDIFTVKFNEHYIGTPTYIEVRDVLTNSTYNPLVNTTN